MGQGQLCVVLPLSSRHKAEIETWRYLPDKHREQQQLASTELGDFDA